MALQQGTDAASDPASGEGLATEDLQRVPMRLWVTFVVVTVGIVVATGLLIGREYHNTWKLWEGRLNGVAEALQDRVSDWLTDRYGDAQILAEDPLVAQALSEAPMGDQPAAPQTAPRYPELTRHLDQVAAAHRCAGVYVADRGGRTMAQSTHAPPLAAVGQAIIESVVRDRRPQTDLLGDNPHTALVAFTVPVPATPALSAPETAAPVIGAIVLADVSVRTLASLIYAETNPTGTGETLLMQRQGDDIVFLTPQRDPAASVRVPFNTMRLAARAALDGQETFGEFVDYRGVPVFAATRYLPETGWGLVRKIDRSEALRGFYWIAGAEMLGAACLILVVGGLLRAAWHRRQQQALMEALRKERHLRDAEKHLRVISENALDLVAIVTRDGTYRYASPSHTPTLGFTPDELIGKNCFELLHPDDIGAAQAMLRDGGPSTIGKAEFRFRGKGGAWRVVSAVARDCTNDPAIQGILINARDITERKRAEEALREREQRFRLLADSMPELVWTAEPDGTFDFVNARVRERITMATKVDHTYPDLIHLDDVQRTLGAWQHALRTGDPYEIEHRLRCPGGAYRWHVSRAIPVRDAGGAIIKWYGSATDIHELRDAKERFRQNEARLRLAIGAANVGLFDWDLGTNQVRYSPEWKRQIGYEDHEISNDFSEWESRVHPDDLPRCLQTVRSYLADPWPNYEQEFRFRHRDGSYRWIMTQAALLRDEQGKALRMLGSHVDITERKRAGAALRESERRFRHMMENVQLITLMLDERGYVQFCNDYFLRLTGWQREEVLGRDYFETFIPPDARDRMRQVYQSLRQGENGSHYVNEIITRSGERRLISWNNTSLNDGAGTVVGVASIAEDITKRKQVEERLLLQSAALTAAANSVVITDANATIRWINPAFTRLTGYTADEVIGQNPRVLKSGRQDAAFYAGFWTTISSGQVWTGELINRRKDGTLYTEEMTVAPVHQDGLITHYIAIKQDVTERKHAEAEIEAWSSQLEQRVHDRTAQLETLNRELEAFSHSVSHDLRAPLRAIKGFSAVLLDDYAEKLDEQGRHYLDRVHAGTEHMEQLITDLLGLSRVARAEMRVEACDLSALAQTIAADLQNTQPTRQVEFVIASGLVVAGNAHLLRVALENLLGNAWKYTSKHPRARIEFTTVVQDGQTVYVVRDDGAGFDMAYADKLFGPFQRLHSRDEFEGTGIGLATVQRIIHRHGGRIWAEGAVERGASFSFTLPTRTTTRTGR